MPKLYHITYKQITTTETNYQEYYVVTEQNKIDSAWASEQAAKQRIQLLTNNYERTNN